MTVAGDVPARALVESEVRRSRLRLLVLLVLVGTVAAIGYHYVSAYYIGYDYPRTTFLMDPLDRFNDWDNLYVFAEDFLRGVPGPYAYYPFAILFAVASTVLPMRAGFVVLEVLFVVVLVVLLWRWALDCEDEALLRLQELVVLVAFSYPVLFALDRGNIEILIFVLLAGFFYFLYKHDSAWLAGLLLAAAIALKLYPATLLLLLVAERRLKALVVAVAGALVLTAASTLAVTALGHFTLGEFWDMNAEGKALYQQTMVWGGYGVHHGHALWSLLKVPSMVADTGVPQWHSTLYVAGAAVIFIAVALHVLFRETERWRRVLLCVVPALLLPYVSADYTLIHLYFPLVFFLRAPRVPRWDPVIVVVFAVLLVPVDYVYFTPLREWASVSIVVYPIALLALMALAVWAPRAPAAPGAPLAPADVAGRGGAGSSAVAVRGAPASRGG